MFKTKHWSRISLCSVFLRKLYIFMPTDSKTEELKPTDHAQWGVFVEWIMEQQKLAADLSNQIIFSNETHFHLNGFANWQKFCIWSLENPKVIGKKQMEAQHLTFVVRILNWRLYLTMLLRKCNWYGNNDKGCSLLQNNIFIFWLKSQNMNVNDIWLQQDIF